MFWRVARGCVKDPIQSFKNLKRASQLRVLRIEPGPGTRGADLAVSIDAFPGGRASSLVFIRYQGNQTEADLIKQSRDTLIGSWETSSAGGI